VKPVPYVGLGVDRVDYTPRGFRSGFAALSGSSSCIRLYREKLTFVQIGAPSRTRIKRYQDLMTEVEEEAGRINRRFRTGAWKPIVFLN
jgi:trehalose-6-phosphate synthase